MEIVSGKTGSPHVTSQQFRQILEGTAGQGSCILTSGENLEPELTSNNLLKIRSGIMAHHGNVSAVKIGTYDEVTITNGTQGMKRKDLVVNRYTRNKETGIETNEWLYIMGTPTSGTPTVPGYTQGNLQEGDLLFVDEIHRLSRQVEEVLYPAMEDFEIDIMIGKGATARSIRLDLPKFTLVGATTRVGLLTAPLRDRFGVVHKLDFIRQMSLCKCLSVLLMYWMLRLRKKVR